MTNIKFAVVREDPSIEAALIERINNNNVLMVASGGCTALSLKSIFLKTNFTLFDINPNQIQLVKDKVNNLLIDDSDLFNKQFNIGDDSAGGLNNCGEFESLFRSFRRFVTEFILPESAIKDIFLGASSPEALITNKYWPVAFDLFFSNSLLLAMFGAKAIQYAKPNSYPKYFQNVFEKGLSRENYKNNYFLHHIFLGCYLNDSTALPYYLQNKNKFRLNFEYINDQLLNIEDLNRFGLVSLSNIFDWMAPEEVKATLEYLAINLQKGAFIIFRQLNNDVNHMENIKGFIPHDKLALELLSKDNSLFYNKINIFEKI